MRTIFFSAFLALLILNCFSHLANADMSCGTVNMKAASCVTFATGKVPKPAPACCTGLQFLADNAKTVNDRKAICRCLKAGVKNFAGVQDRFLSAIPEACHIKVGFPVSMNTDCEKLH